MWRNRFKIIVNIGYHVIIMNNNLINPNLSLCQDVEVSQDLAVTRPNLVPDATRGVRCGIMIEVFGFSVGTRRLLRWGLTCTCHRVTGMLHVLTRRCGGVLACWIKERAERGG